MPRGQLYTYFVNDHARLDDLLTSTTPRPGEIDVLPFREFRSGILRHIWQEERLLLPAVQNGQAGEPFQHATRLRLDHGAIAALLVPPPSLQTISAVRHILTLHNPLEEGPGGLYERCEAVVKKDVTHLMSEVFAAPAIPTMPFNDDPAILPALKRALARAGYDYDAVVSRI